MEGRIPEPMELHHTNIINKKSYPLIVYFYFSRKWTLDTTNALRIIKTRVVTEQYALLGHPIGAAVQVPLGTPVSVNALSGLNSGAFQFKLPEKQE